MDDQKAAERKKKKAEYNVNYAKQNLKRIPLDVSFEMYERIKSFAAERNESVNGFIKRVILQELDK